MLRTFTVERQTLALLKQLQQMPLLQASRLVGGTALNTKSIHVFQIEGVKMDIVNYPYEWLEEPIEDKRE